MRRVLLPVVALVATLAAPLSPATADDHYEVYEVEAEVPVTDATGTTDRVVTIRVEVERPTRGDGPVPVILTYSPYTNLSSATDGRTANASGDWTAKGYARAVADVIGTRGSTGCWDYGGRAEQLSGVAVVEFLAGNRNEKLDGSGADITWSNGNVGMIGGSYDGTTATMVAATGTPGLKAIVPEAAISRWYGYAYENGVRYLLNSFAPTDEGFDTPLAFDLGFGRTVEPHDATRDPDALARQAAARTGECATIEHTVEAYHRSPDYDAFWVERDYVHDVSDYRASVLITHGWQDFNVKQRQAIDLWQALQANDHIPYKLLWMHQGTHQSASDGDFAQLLDEFFTVTLKGVPLEETEVMRERVETTPVHSITRTLDGPGEVHDEPSWPPPATRDVTLHLARAFDYDQPGLPRDGLVGSTGETGLLAPEPLDSPDGNLWTWVDTGAASEPGVENDPLNEPGHGYYSLYYASAPLAADTRVAGSITVDAWLRPMRPAGAHFTPVVLDVSPDGDVRVVARGFLNLDYAEGLDEARPADPLTWVHAAVDLLPQDHTFRAGHRIALITMSSNTVWAVPGNAADLVTMTTGPYEPDGIPASVLRLPVVGAPDDPADLFAEPVGFGEPAGDAQTGRSRGLLRPSLAALTARALTEVPSARAVRGGARSL